MRKAGRMAVCAGYRKSPSMSETGTGIHKDRMHERDLLVSLIDFCKDFRIHPKAKLTQILGNRRLRLSKEF